MEPVQEVTGTAGNCPAPSQTPVKTWRSSSKRVTSAPKMPGDTAARFQGDGIRYKAKLIGMDPVPEAHDDKMCLDTMMKLKGLEAASRSQGKHKQRIWLKVSISGLKIVDERTGLVEHDHASGKIGSLRKDESDPRALAYIYQHQNTCTLFYIKMANLADPVLDDITEVCQHLDQETPQGPIKTSAESSCLLLLDESLTCQPKSTADLDNFNPLQKSQTEQLKQASSIHDELMDIFSVQQDNCQPGSPPEAMPISQILSSYSAPPAGGSPYPSPTTMIWGQPAPFTSMPANLKNQWPGMAHWPSQHMGMEACSPAGALVAPGGAQSPAYTNPQPGLMWGQSTGQYTVGHPPPLNTLYCPPLTDVQQPWSPIHVPTTTHNPSLE